MPKDTTGEGKWPTVRPAPPIKRHPSHPDPKGTDWKPTPLKDTP
jgi:hypothetical protein